MSLQPYQERAVAEEKELRERFDKLVAFIGNQAVFYALPEEDQNLLWRQHYYMAGYLDAIVERIARFK